MKRDSYEKNCQWNSKAFNTIPMSVNLNEFQKITIYFYDETQIENSDFDSENENTSTFVKKY